MPDTRPDRFGAAIRARRLDLGMTIVQLAELADLSHPFISQVERGKASPSLDSLARIARALGTSQVELMSGTSLTSAEATTGLFAGNEARVLTSGETRFTVIDMEGDGTDIGEHYVHPEDEFVTVLAGTVTFDLGPGRTETLSTGDSRYIRGDTPHRWASVDGSRYRVLVVKERHAHGSSAARKDSAA